jgi:aminoglycoside phosphotransferase (APT) family kinase protein
MPTGKMHADEVGTDVPLVRRLLAAQFPARAGLPICPVASTGTVNAMYRLGDDMVVRLPGIHWAIEGLHREIECLPRLAPHLPVPIPVLLGTGAPAEGYPWQWCVYRWLKGDNPEIGYIAEPLALARDLAAFTSALRTIDPSVGPPSDQSLRPQDAQVRSAIEALSGTLPADALNALTGIWETALHTPDWDGPPVWLHGDLSPGNLLVIAGRLSGVIDFSAVGEGDPAADLRVAWNVLPRSVRENFRAALRVDDATWARARGRALAQALIHLHYYKESKPVLVANARQVIQEILYDFRPAGHSLRR